jgi:hypothetical protein
MGLMLKRPREEIKELTKEQGNVWIPFAASISVGTAWAMFLQYMIAGGIIKALPFFSKI